MLIKKRKEKKEKLLCNYSITTQVLEQSSSRPGKVRVWHRPVQSGGVEVVVSRELRGGGGRGGRGFGWERDQCRVVVVVVLLQWWRRLCVSLCQQCCKAVLHRRAHSGQARQRKSVFGFLNGPLQFKVGALQRRFYILHFKRATI